LPKTVKPEELTLEEAPQLTDARAARGARAKGRARKAPAKKAPAKKAAAKGKKK